MNGCLCKSPPPRNIKRECIDWQIPYIYLLDKSDKTTKKNICSTRIWQQKVSKKLEQGYITSSFNNTKYLGREDTSSFYNELNDVNGWQVFTAGGSGLLLVCYCLAEMRKRKKETSLDAWREWRQFSYLWPRCNSRKHTSTLSREAKIIQNPLMEWLMPDLRITTFCAWYKWSLQW